jgi:hypothetical protein
MMPQPTNFFRLQQKNRSELSVSMGILLAPSTTSWA